MKFGAQHRTKKIGKAQVSLLSLRHTAHARIVRITKEQELGHEENVEACIGMVSTFRKTDSGDEHPWDVYVRLTGIDDKETGLDAQALAL